jgi:hypothetical protein
MAFRHPDFGVNEYAVLIYLLNHYFKNTKIYISRKSTKELLKISAFCLHSALQNLEAMGFFEMAMQKDKDFIVVQFTDKLNNAIV